MSSPSGGADRLEILGHVRGSDVGQELLAHLVHAALDEGLGSRSRCARRRRGCSPPWGRRAAGRCPRRSCTTSRVWSWRHAAWVEADEIETLAHRLRQRGGHRRGRLDTGLTRTAGVDDQRADLVAGGLESDHRDLGDVAVGLASSRPAPTASRTRLRPACLASVGRGDLARPPLHRCARPRCAETTARPSTSLAATGH